MTRSRLVSESKTLPMKSLSLPKALIPRRRAGLAIGQVFVSCFKITHKLTRRSPERGAPVKEILIQHRLEVIKLKTATLFELEDSQPALIRMTIEIFLRNSAFSYQL